MNKQAFIELVERCSSFVESERESALEDMGEFLSSCDLTFVEVLCRAACRQPKLLSDIYDSVIGE